MATNFEFYNEDIQKIINSKEIRCVVGAFADKIGTETTCPDGCYQCYINLFKFLCAEHIEQPKLTKRERAFCEIVQTGLIARDEDGGIHLFEKAGDPYKSDREWLMESEYGDYIRIKSDEFDFIRWEDENPWSIEDLLKLEVIEEANE